MTSVSIAEAQAKLAELVHGLAPGEEIAITEGDQQIAKITGTKRPLTPRRLGTMAGTVLHIAPDFDAPLEDFKDYME